MNAPAPPAGARHRAAVGYRPGIAAVLGAVAVLTAACGSQGGASHAAGPGGRMIPVSGGPPSN